MHIAVLKEKEEIVQYLATNIKQALHIGDNVCEMRRYENMLNTISNDYIYSLNVLRYIMRWA